LPLFFYYSHALKCGRRQTKTIKRERQTDRETRKTREKETGRQTETGRENTEKRETETDREKREKLLQI